jgi:glycosyltransferase involved in cell wall biosynthesis
MHQPLISIVTVVYNAQNVLEQTLRSAINQTYKNIELVIVDGGSTDRTLAIAQSFSQYTGTLISEKDKGIYDAMNKGIQAAKGEWIYFLNAGDSFYNDSVLSDVFSTDYKDAELIYAKVQTINEPTGINYLNGAEVSLKDFYNRFPICHQSAFTQKAAFNRIGLYDLRYKLVADHQWFVRFFKTTPEKAYFIDRVVAFYDIQGTSYHKRMQSQRELLKYGRELFDTPIWIINYLLYPLTYIKVFLIRTFQQTSLFKLYRKWKFKVSRNQQQLTV